MVRRTGGKRDAAASGDEHRKHARAFGPRGSVMATALLLLLAGCSGGGGTAAREQSGDVNAGLTALASGTDGPLPMAKAGALDRSQIEALAQKSAVDLESVLNKPSSDSAGLNALNSPSTNGAGEVATDSALQKAQEAGKERTLADGSVVPAGGRRKSDAGASPDEKIGKLSDELAGLLRERAASSKAPFGDAVALVGIEAVRPGVLKDLESKASPFAANIADTDKRSLETLRVLVSDLSRPDGASDPARVSTALRAAADRLADQQAVKISRAALCTRVTGYGQIDPIASNTFIGGRAARAILYIELEDFANRQETGKNGQTQWTVEVSRELGLYASGMLAWHRKPQTVRESSLNKRRDFYLIEEVELPATLGVGRYDLKVTVRDQGGVQTEYTLPIQIVADGSVR